MTSTAHNCGGARRLSGAAAAAEAEEAATAVARLARARTSSWAGASAESEFFFELFPPAAGEKILQYTSKNGDLACSTVLHSTVKLRPK